MYAAIFSVLGAIASVIGMLVGAITAPTAGLLFIGGLCFGLGLDGMQRKRPVTR